MSTSQAMHGADESAPHQPLVLVEVPRPSRIRIVLCILFIIAYVAGAGAMAAHFKNIAAAVGFGITAALIGFYLVLLQHRPETVRHCTFLSISSKGLACCVVLCMAGVATACYWLYRGVDAHQAWNGESYFCAMIAFLMAAKWSLFCALRIRLFRKVAAASLLLGAAACPWRAEDATVQGVVVQQSYDTTASNVKHV